MNWLQKNWMGGVIGAVVFGIITFACVMGDATPPNPLCGSMQSMPYVYVMLGYVLGAYIQSKR